MLVSESPTARCSMHEYINIYVYLFDYKYMRTEVG